MNWKNPTAIKLGMSARFFGQTYHVAGLAALGVMEGGKIYYWYEYYLKSEKGDIATLVYERTRLRGEWRWFVQYVPQIPLNAADAAMKRQGDYVMLDDDTAEVVLVRESRIYHVEGATPEGVRTGAWANYFNAKNGTKLFVVSWTGPEIEFYRGRNLERASVASAFKLKTLELVPEETKSQLSWIVVCAAIILGLMALFSIANTARSSLPPSRIRILALPAPALKLGDSGTLRGINYRVDGRAEIEIAEVGNVLIRHEYILHDADGNDALLVYGWNGGKKLWLLFTTLHPAEAPSAFEAARMKLGEKLAVGDVPANVSELFRSTVLNSEGTNNPIFSLNNMCYGLAGKAGTNFILARWNQDGISFSEGKRLSEREVSTAFSQTRKK